MNPGTKKRGVAWFSDVVLLPSLPDNNPALVNVESKLLRLSGDYWKRLPHLWKVYIIYHELGHINAGKSEEAAEKWALKHFIAHGYSVKEAINAHTEVYAWDKVNSQQAQGLIAKTHRALELAKIHDFHHNGNTSLFNFT